MIRYTATEARRELFRILDAVEQGEKIVLERRGIRFQIVLQSSDKEIASSSKKLEVSDPAVLTGEWTWVADEKGELEFAARGEEED